MQRATGSGRARLLIGAAFLAALVMSACATDTQTDAGDSSRANRSSTHVKEPTREAAAPEPEGKTQSQGTCADGTQPRTMLLGGNPQSAGHRPTSWAGDIVEPHGAQYRLLASISDDGCEASGTFDYQGLGCSGTWTMEHAEEISSDGVRPNAVRIQFRETVTHDPQNACAATAEVSMLMGPAGMFYSSNWDRSDGESTASKTHLDPVN